MKAAEYNISVRQKGRNASDWAGRAIPTDMGEYNKFSFELQNLTKLNGAMSGDYVLLITKQLGSKPGPAIYKNCAFRVTNGHFSILQYDKVISENARIDKNANKKKKASAFKKTNLSDVKTVSNEVVKGASTNYEKLLKIYEYVAENFYYDDVAFSSGSKQYIDPYRNLYNMRNKKKSANSEDGKVATTCVGYSAAVCALARAQGIPTRIVNGHHISLNGTEYNNWSTEKNITKLDHWWNECYVDGRWITVDATPGNSNKWDRNTNTWTYTGLTNYIYFDSTPEQLATSHMLLAVKGI